jgi:acyl-coenzyme A thioesterase PaaI-like protein
MPPDAESTAGERLAEIRRVADALRDLIERFVATTAPVDVFSGLADELQRITARLSDYPQGALYFGYAEAAMSGQPDAPFDHSPFIGRANPLAPPIDIEFVDDRVEGRVTFGSAYEGPPGCVHGGFVAATFDDLLGFTQTLAGHPGMTGRLTVHYRNPTPLHQELRLVGELVDVSGRKISTVGRLYAGDMLTAEAEGLFITIDPARFEQLRAARDGRRSGQGSSQV